MLQKVIGKKMVCPWWLCFTFDNPVRRLLQDPETILSPYVGSGDTVIDVGAGMGYFTIPLAKLVGPTGRVTAIDIQAQMLEALASRARRCGVGERIKLHLATSDSLGSHQKADFVNAFWMVHEVLNQRTFLTEILDLLKPAGLFLLTEPIVHVRKKRFLQTMQTAKEVGFAVKDLPKIRFSHSALFTRNGSFS